MQTERTHVTYMAYKFYSGKLAQYLELKTYCHISGNWRLDLCANVEVWYTWLTELDMKSHVGCLQLLPTRVGLNLILAPPCEGALGPLTKRSRQTFFGAP